MTIMSDNTGQPYVSVELDDNGEMVSGVRQDGLHDVSLSLDMEMWGILGLQAHAADITLNEHLINVIMASVADTDGMELTPDEWLQYDPDFKYTSVIDPDGWDRSDYEVSWATPITKDVMLGKLMVSTTLISKSLSG